MMRKFGAAALAATLLSTTALHAVTADEVWAEWQQQYAAYGFKGTTGSQVRQGDTLVLSDVHLSNASDDKKVDLTIPELRMRETGNDTVEVTLSREMTGKVGGSTSTGEPLELDLHVTQTDTRILVSGTDANRRYEYTAPVVVIDMTQPAVPGTTESGAVDLTKAQPAIAMQITASGSEGEQRYEKGSEQRVVASGTVQSVQFAMTTHDTTEAGAREVKLRGDIADVKSESTTVTPLDATFEDMNAAMAQGLVRSNGSATYGASTWTVETTGEDGLTTVSGTADSGDFTVAVAPEGVRYAMTTQASKVKVELPGMPLPFSGALETAQFDVSFPMRKSDAPQPYSGKIGLKNLTLSDEVWAIVDPRNNLPHTPATLTLDLDGTARPLTDLFSPEAAAQEQMPVEFDSLNISGLQLTALGADLTGHGALTFGRGPEGETVPEGAMDLRLAGGNGLMDNLTAMQLVPQDQMMFVRMMLGLYAVAAGDDLYTSKIEFKSGGEILANGQRIR
ncbi:hypothetical protein [Paenirhodobacter sp.]|uniref:hypothetical protein n=1 Tax=Paenirhodobacter sp. TaxID=1965326 RepID=UPI003B3F5E46